MKVSQKQLIQEYKTALLEFIGKAQAPDQYDVKNHFKAKGKRLDALNSALGQLVYEGLIEVEYDTSLGETEDTIVEVYSIPQA